LEFSAEYEKKLDAYLQKNAESRKKLKEKKDIKDSKPLHEYHPEDFGLTAELISSEFKDYIQKYNL
jgi:hypothetical protein